MAKMRAESGRDVQALSNSFNARFNYLYPYTMKKALLILLTLLTLTNVMYSQTDAEFLEDKDNLRGRVKSFTQTTYNTFTGAMFVNTKHENTETFRFDDKGKRLSRTLISRYRFVDSRTYTYDIKGNIIKIVEYDESGREVDVSNVQYIYDNKGNLIESINEEHHINKYIYDNKGNLIECQRFLKSDTGLMMEYTYLCKCDDKGNLTESKIYFGEAGGGSLWIWRTYEYQYDQYGNWITKTTKWPESTQNSSITTRKYEYYPQNSSNNADNTEDNRIATNDVFIWYMFEQKKEKPALDLHGKMLFYVVQKNKFEYYLGKNFKEAVSAGKRDDVSNFTITENGIILEGRKGKPVPFTFDENGNLRGKAIAGVGIMLYKTNEKFIPKKEIEAPANAVTGFSWYQNNVFVSVDDIGEPVSVSGQFMYFYVHMSDGEEKVLFFIGSSWEKALLNGIQKEGSLREINEYKNYFSYSWDGEPNKIISLQWAGNGNFKTENCLSDCAIIKNLELASMQPLSRYVRVKNYAIPTILK